MNNETTRDKHERSGYSFEDRNGDAWCKHLSGVEARLALTFIAALDEVDFNAIPVKPVKIYRREVKDEA